VEKEWRTIADKHGFKLKDWREGENRYDFELHRDGVVLYSMIRIFDEVEIEDDIEYPKMIELSMEAYSQQVAGIYFEFGSTVLHDIYQYLIEKGRVAEHEVVPCGLFILDLDQYRIIKENEDYEMLEEKFGHFVESVRNNQTNEGVEEGAFEGQVGQKIAEYFERKGLGQKKRFYNTWLFYFKPYCPHEIYDKIEEMKEKWGA